MELRQVTARLFRASGWLTVVVPGVLFLGLGLESMRQPPARPYSDFRAVAHWFDPVFFQYTVILALLAVVIVPMVALCYVGPMVARKQRRLEREIPESRRPEIEGRMASRIKFGAFFGSVALATIVVMLGASILLLFKPVQSGVGGVNFGLGANMLMLGPFIKMIASSPQEVYARLICSLTAF